jgi:hypothetical protein
MIELSRLAALTLDEKNGSHIKIEAAVPIWLPRMLPELAANVGLPLNSHAFCEYLGDVLAKALTKDEVVRGVGIAETPSMRLLRRALLSGPQTRAQLSKATGVNYPTVALSTSLMVTRGLADEGAAVVNHRASTTYILTREALEICARDTQLSEMDRAIAEEQLLSYK